MSALPADNTPNHLAHALAYAARGWRVIPIPPGAKHPAIPAWQTAGTTDPDRIRHWWSTAPDHGVGIVTGAASRIWVLDVDVADDKTGADTLAELEATYGPLPATYEVRTGSGGRHLYFAWPDDAVVRNSASGALGAHLDVRGEGGQVLAPPTVHPTGTRYTVARDIDPVPAPGWLLALLERPAEKAEEAKKAAPRGDRPGDRWAAATTWATILEADGWLLHHTDHDGEQHWTRPGKDRREGTSATIGYRGNDTLKVFTSSVPWLDAEQTYSKLGYLAARDHHGDLSAAARHLAATGYGRTSLEDLAARLPEADIDWPDPQPIRTETTPPPFPLHTLPEWCQAHAEAVADAIQVPADLPAMLIIGSLAAAATGRLDAAPGPEWVEPANLYLATVMRSGAGKSPAEKACVAWLRRWQTRRIEETAETRDKALFRAGTARKKAADAQKGYELGSVSEDDAWAAQLAAVAAEADVPPVPRIIIDDATPEAVATLLRAHSERLAIMSTEADLFDMVLGDGRKKPNINVYLKAWSGDALVRDRKGSTDAGPEVTELARPLLTVSAAVQPSVLQRIRADAELVGRGFVARFMLSIPVDMIGTRDHSARFQAGGITTRHAYETAATAYADRLARYTTPTRLRFDPDAEACLLRFMTEVEPQLATSAALDVLAEWSNKCYASVARYAAILHAAEGHDTAEPVSGETCARAVELGWYWVAHAHHAYATAADLTGAQAVAILEHLAELPAGSTPSVNSIHKAIRRPGIGLDRARDFVPALELLVDNGWLVPVDNLEWAESVGTGRKSPKFAVWTGLHEMGWRSHLVSVVSGEYIGGEKSSPYIPPTPTREPLTAHYAHQKSGSYPQGDPFEGLYADDELDET